jgi:hypothetical protein
VCRKNNPVENVKVKVYTSITPGLYSERKSQNGFDFAIASTSLKCPLFPLKKGKTAFEM